MRTREAYVTLCTTAALTVLVIGFSLATHQYNETHPAQYSALNHFASELGWALGNQGAWIYNSSIVAGGLLSLPLFNELKKRFTPLIGRIIGGLAMMTALTGSALGIVTLDHLIPHVTLAFVYFSEVLTTSVILTGAMWFCPFRDRAKLSIISSILLALVTLAFLFVQSSSAAESLKMLHRQIRPPVWSVATLEWSVLIVSGLWLGSLLHFILNTKPAADG